MRQDFRERVLQTKKLMKLKTHFLSKADILNLVMERKIKKI